MISLKYSYLLSDSSPVSIQGNNDAQKLTSSMLPAPPWVREDTQASMQDTSRLTVELKRKETDNWVIDSKWTWTINEPHLPEKRRVWMLCKVIHCSRMLFSKYQGLSAVLGSLGDVNCYLIHKRLSNGWPYPYNKQESRPAYLERYGSSIVHACLCVSN